MLEKALIIHGLLPPNDVPARALNSIKGIFDVPQFEARERLVTLEVSRDCRGSSTYVVNVVPKLTATPGQIVSLGPPLGNANNEIYRGLLELSTAEIQRCERQA